jgi:hypothetical protein
MRLALQPSMAVMIDQRTLSPAASRSETGNMDTLQPDCECRLAFTTLLPETLISDVMGRQSQTLCRRCALPGLLKRRGIGITQGGDADLRQVEGSRVNLKQ